MPPEWLSMLVAVHLTATLYMLGVIWFVQIVHYPLLACIHPNDVPSYERTHTRLANWAIAPAMILELAAVVALAWLRPDELTLAGLGLLVIIWLSTWTVQIPCHVQLSQRFDPAIHRRLVRSNWIRTAAWSLRAAVAWAIWFRIPA